MRKVHCGYQIEEVAAPQIIQTDSVEFWRGLVDISAGKGHGLRIGIITGGYRDEQVEILGPLPHHLRRGLKRAIPWWETVRRGQVPWAWYDITWCPNLAGDGLRYAIPSRDVLIGLLVARRKILSEGAQ